MGIACAETDGATLRRASSAAVSAFGKQRALLHQAGTYHGQGGALGEHIAPLGDPSGYPLLRPFQINGSRACSHNPDAVQRTAVNSQDCRSFQ